MSDADKRDQDNVSALFVQLVLSFQAAAWQQMGKITNPLTGKIERSLEMAKNSIDILGMIEEKTRGNLTEDETKFLRHILTELRMNYVEEMKKPEPEKEAKPETGKSEKPPADNSSS